MVESYFCGTLGRRGCHALQANKYFLSRREVVVTADKIGIIVNGATGAIATRQHLESALVAIRDEGGIEVAGTRVVPRLLLVSRNEERLAETARRFGIEEWTTSLDDAIANLDLVRRVDKLDGYC